MEALAIVYSLNQFKPYTEGTGTILVRTDNAVACSLMNKKDLVGRMAKYQLGVQAFDIKIEHRSGRSNTFCDFMSRYPGECSTVGTREKVEKVLAIEADQLDWEELRKRLEKNVVPKDFTLPKEFRGLSDKWKKVSMEEIRNEQKKDRNYKIIMDELENVEIPESEEEIQKYLDENKVHAEFSLINGILYKWAEFGKDRRAVISIPPSLRERILREFHQDKLIGAHLGFFKTFDKLRKKVWWKRMYGDTKRFIVTCQKCQRRKTIPAHLAKEPIKPIDIAQHPFDRIHLDILGPLPQTLNGNRYILTIVDAFSKWLIGVPMVDQTAQTVSNGFVDFMISKFGCPRVLVTDNGKQLTGKIFEDLSKIYEYRHNRTTTYHPQSNGAVERLNKVIADMLSAYVNSKGDDWDAHLQLVTFAYNCSTHASSNYSPYIVVFGRDPIVPVDLRWWSEYEYEREVSMSEYLKQKIDDISHIWEMVRFNLEKAQNNQKYFADRGRKTKEHEFNLYDLVLLKIDRLPSADAHKFRMKWRGPFRIVEIRGPVLTVQDLEGNGNKEKVHMDKAKRFLTEVYTPLRKGIEKRKVIENIEDERDKLEAILSVQSREEAKIIICFDGEIVIAELDTEAVSFSSLPKNMIKPEWKINKELIRVGDEKRGDFIVFRETNSNKDIKLFIEENTDKIILGWDFIDEVAVNRYKWDSDGEFNYFCITKRGGDRDIIMPRFIYME